MILLTEEMDLLKRLAAAGGSIPIPTHASLDELKALFALVTQKLIRVEEQTLSLSPTGQWALDWGTPRLDGKVWTVEGPEPTGDAPQANEAGEDS